MKSSRLWFALTVPVTLTLACEKAPAPTESPEPAGSTVAAVPDQVAPASEADQGDPGEKTTEAPVEVGEDAIAVGVFNLMWAHDSDDDRPKLAQRNMARSDEDWVWKTEAIADLLVAHKLDVVVLTELGGERELGDITEAVREKGGTSYDYPFVDAEDRFTGQNVAIISKFDVSDERRLDIKLQQHLVTEIELPGGEVITIAALQLRGGDTDERKEKRVKQARSIKRKLATLQRKRPVLILGTTESSAPPDERGYQSSAAGVLSGASSRGTHDDDCQDSANYALSTTAAGELRDHIFACGLEMRGAAVGGQDRIVREDLDPPKSTWSEIPIHKSPHRDISNHLLLWAEIVVPGSADDEDDGGGDED